MATKLEKQQERELNAMSALASVQLTKIKRLEKRILTLERRIEKLEQPAGVPAHDGNMLIEAV